MKTIVTPQMASDFLKKNHNNRPLAQHYVDKLTNAILNGNWVYNGESIKFDKNNNLLDGQHRLHAIIKANVPVEIEIICDLESSVFKTIDQARTRGLSDFIAISGADYWVEKSALTRHLFFYNNYKYETRKVINSRHTTQMLFDYYTQHKTEIDEEIMLCRHLKKNNSIINFSKIAFFNYLFSKISKPASSMFINELLTGYNLSVGSPIASLREALIKEKLFNKLRISNIITIDMVFKTWNLFREGKNVKLNHIKPDYKVEALPDLI